MHFTGFSSEKDGPGPKNRSRAKAVQTTVSAAQLPLHFRTMRKIEKGLLILAGVLIAGMILIIEWIA
jgi:hypothetical protein